MDAANEALWRERVDKVLKGAPFDTLVSRTRDGIAVQPLYTKGEARSRALRQRPERPWRIVARLDHPDAAAANDLALKDLAGGADGLALVFSGAPSARGFGISPDNLGAALAGVELDLIALRLDLPPGGEARAIEAVRALIAEKRLDPASLDADFGLDPIGAGAASGRLDAGWEKHAGALARSLTDAGFVSPAFRADGRIHHDAGASEAQELAAVLATGIAYLRLLEEAGVPLEEARGLISFQLAADADQFAGITKFRALRRLWARVETACGLSAAPIRLSAETSFRMVARRDPAVNWLRTTSALFAAATGGADQICVLAHTIALGLPDAFARRMARNEQVILIEESQLARVADPAAGSGAVEALTEALCKAAWARLQRFEAEGGLPAALASGVWQREIEDSRQKRAQAIADGSAPLVGATIFLDEAERPASVLMPAPVPQEAGEGDFAPLLPMRDAERSEAEGAGA